MLRADGLAGSCKCGAVRYRCPAPASAPANVFVCHCSMCPAGGAEPHGGAGWAGVPRPRYSGPFRESSTPPPCTRGVCEACGASVFIRYTCEGYTGWALHQSLAPPGGACPGGKCWHIRCTSRHTLHLRNKGS